MGSKPHLRVLYIGSDSLLVERVTDELGCENAVVVKEPAAPDALDRLSEESFACVVCDDELADSDWESVRQSVAEHDAALPFLLLVSDGATDQVLDALDADRTEYVLLDAEPAPYAVTAQRIQRAAERYRTTVPRTGAGGTVHTLLAETTDTICVLDESGTIQYVSPSGDRLFECEPSTLTGKEVGAITHPDDVDRIHDVFETVLAKPERTVTVQFRIECNDGSWCWVECRARNQLSNPAVNGVVVTLTDISQHKQRERELRRFREVVEQAGHAIYITDPDGLIEYVNPAFEESTGYSYEEAVGENPNILNSGEHSSEYYASLWNTILSGSTWKGEVINERKNGHQYVVEQTIAPVETADGEIDRFVAINTDITQRKAYEQKLEQYEHIIENLPVGVFRTTPGDDGEFVEVNSELVSIYDAYSKSELLQRNVSEFYADADERAAFSQSLREEGTITGLEVEQETLAGETIQVSLTAMKVEEDGEVYFDGILQDITDRKRRERELERKNEQLEQFASIVTHDLRNPLNAAQSRLELVERSCEDEELHENMAVIDEQLVRMEELIEDVLAIARHGQQVEDTERVDLARLVESCWQTVETDAAEIVVDTDLTLDVDTGRAQQLFENLFRNAIEHGGRDVTVRVGTLADGFYVEDDGPGIDPEDRDEVFDHGYTTHSSGTGFGLNIVKEIVDAHGWSISVTEGTSGGARFEISGIGNEHE
ncbi:PAS domain-containing sensor histidine kinase [Halorientalis brevis]|uniref:histidine kinase n=1 Tax=Halorientalis brevis TaxID=1126241 RepID=A0ABD6CCE4_9EURY|nr:PAS domain S-box protein [Halorientalis brevis]